MAIPSSANQEVSSSTPTYLSILPSGTIPDSPAPIHAALALEPAELAASPVSSPVLEMNPLAESILTPIPGTNLAFEDVQLGVGPPPSPAKISQKHSGYFGIVFNEGREEICHSSYVQFDHEGVREAGAKAPKELPDTYAGT